MVLPCALWAVKTYASLMGKVCCVYVPELWRVARDSVRVKLHFPLATAEAYVLFVEELRTMPDVHVLISCLLAISGQMQGTYEPN